MIPTLLLSLSTSVPAAQDPGYEPGQVHPDFVLPALDGDVGRLSDFRGDKVVVFHFASW